MPLATKRKARKPISAMTIAVMPTLIAAEVGFTCCPAWSGVVAGVAAASVELTVPDISTNSRTNGSLRAQDLVGQAGHGDLALVEHRDAVARCERSTPCRG